jgi:hypothetical protein
MYRQLDGFKRPIGKTHSDRPRGQSKKREKPHGNQEIQQTLEQGKEARADQTVETETERTVVAQSFFVVDACVSGSLPATVLQGAALPPAAPALFFVVHLEDEA